jgi:MYXO-CTERM domain-containing protein
MKQISRITAALALGAACALPVMAQDTSATTGNTTQGTQSTPSTPSTQTMGAGPDTTMDTRSDEHRDMGWIGLLGLAGLLGLRRRHHHDDDQRYNRTTTAR